MERVLTWIKENPQIAAVGFGFLVVTLVVTVLGGSMLKAGVSLRPLVWFVVFFLIIAGPQAVAHLIDGLAIRRAAQAAPAPVAPDGARGATVELTPVAWPVVFGPKADPQLFTDAKQPFAAILGRADEAKLSFSVDGTSALAARFSSREEAARALDHYGTFFAFAGARGSDAAGWTARRHGGQGEWVHVVRAGAELYAWTGASEAAVLEPRIRALGPLPADSATGGKPTKPAPDLFTNRLRARPGLMAAVVVINLFLAVGWFFKGSAWAARVEATPTALPSARASLRSELLALNRPDSPLDVATQPDGTLAITWRYADARWFDLMRVHRMKRTQRLVLDLDERSHTARVREYWSAFDASAGPQDVRLKWVAGTGIQFFAIEHTRVAGVQLGADGRPTGELSKAYTFDLQALKRPLIDAVTRAGWNWQPLVWNTPPALRWLAE